MPAPAYPANPTTPTGVYRGQLYWFDFGYTRGAMIDRVHPCVVVSRTRAAGAQTVMIAPITSLENVTEDRTTTGPLKYPYHALVQPKNVVRGVQGLGLDHDSVAECNMITTQEKADFVAEWYIGQLNAEGSAKLDLALLYGFALEPAFENLVMRSIRLAFETYGKAFSRK